MSQLDTELRVAFSTTGNSVVRTIPYTLVSWQGFVPIGPSPLSHGEAVAQMPIPDAARLEILTNGRERGVSVVA
ncbi:MAG: hypothetical protein JRE71_07275 [Deltaproteobacteria bacterium]|nr:hypothetical protein [Deltaproteobacteria bacterium]